MNRSSVAILQGVAALFEKDNSELLTSLCNTDKEMRDLIAANQNSIEEMVASAKNNQAGNFAKGR